MNSEGVVVETKYGKVKGFDYKADRGFETEIFLGIPFAKPPVEILRFEKPEPPEPWSMILDATIPPKPCLTSPTILNPDGSEDCLYLNVIRPKNALNLPVMVFIHGGAFLIGSALDASYEKASDRIVSQKGVILVTIQYRIGIFGFFSTGDETNPGNLGIWDQIQALTFLNEVISDFGGDPNRITIFGDSAGAASASLLTFIVQADKLFSKSILMSGSIETNWCLTEISVENSKKLLDAVNCHGNSEEQRKCLKEMPAEKIMEGMREIFSDEVIDGDIIMATRFSPRIDGILIKNANFEEEFAKRSKKQTLIGLCSQEYIIFALDPPGITSGAKYLPLSIEDAAAFNETKFEESVRFLLSHGHPYGSKQDEALDDIIGFYKTQQSNYNHHELFQAYVQLLSDVAFNIATMREAVHKKLAGNDVYFYIIDFESEPNPLVDGTGHSSDHIALFGGNDLVPDVPFTGEFEIATDNLAKLLVNFAKNEIPSVGNLIVPQIKANEIPFIRINVKPNLEENLWADRLEFWDQHSKKYGFDWPSGTKVIKTGKDEL
uniref:Carboxylic ester hydrolase n=1 Tax=Panagrolaimus sp. JU765 TaxID=591449 RepID=A0AC34RHI0_9BILA